MTLEHYKEKLPPKSITNRLKDIIYRTPILSEFFAKKVYFNEDKTRKFEIWDWGKDRVPRQRYVRLYTRVGENWLTAMSVMMQWYEGEAPIFGIEIDSVRKPKKDIGAIVKTYYYEPESGGKKRFSGNSTKPENFSAEEGRKAMLEVGFLEEKDLPEYIDFDLTAKQFLAQAWMLDFSNPVLIEKHRMDDPGSKEVLGDGSIK
jgi:hypothetical protein